MSDQNCPSLLSSPSFQTKESLEVQSVHRMIQMLKNYQSNCLEKKNFFEAEASKIRITQLEEQRLKAEHQELRQRNKENVEEADRRNEHEMNMFHEVWEVKIKQHMEEYKLLQEKLKEDHSRELEGVQIKLGKEEPPKIKFSPTVLRLRNHLQNLIKCKMYLEAETTSQQLQNLERQEGEAWIHKFQEKKRKQFQQIIKKQEVQTRALKTKIKSMFNQKMKQKQETFTKVLNRIQKRKVQSSKCPIQLKLKEKEVSKRLGSRSNSLNKNPLGDSRSGFYSITRE